MGVKRKYKNKKNERKALDGYMSDYVRALGKCEKCHVPLSLGSGHHNSHIIGRSEFRTRYDPRNTQSICASCHYYFGNFPLEFADFVRSSSCGQYEQVMKEQHWDRQFKFEYDPWWMLFDWAIENQIPVEQLRERLGQTKISTTWDVEAFIESQID